jgi:branched-chain amino acid transport system substrate-binding protein
MTKRHVLIVSTLALAAVFILVGCAKQEKGPQEILVGVNAPLTGMFAGFGQGGVYGVKAAADDLNKLGGIYVKKYDRKLPIKIIVRDNESDATKSQTLEEELILRDKVHFNSPPNQPLPLVFPQATLADRHKIPRISGGTPMEPWLATRRQATPPWEYSWNYGFSIATPGPAGSYWAKPGYTIMDTWVAMLDLFGGQTNKRVGVFASDEPDGRGWYTLFPKALKDLGYTVIGIDKNLGLLPLETTDFSSMISQWKAEKVEILWGNSPAPFFGTMWKQARALGFKPKMVSIGRAPLFYSDVVAWGGDLPLGIGVEIWWDPSWKDSPGFGDTTPQSLTERWIKEMNQPLNPSIGWGYQQIQILADVITRAGTLDGPTVNQAFAKTDIMTIAHRVKFDEEHYNQKPLVYGQWMKTDKPQKWDLPVVFSQHSFVPATAKPIFPVP